MQLYYSPGACSLASHIALQELGLPYEAVKVNLRDRKTAAGDDFTAVNPKGYVPALKLDNGEVLTEGPALLAYIAELKPEKNLIPKAGTLANYRTREWLTFINGEIHKAFSPLFRPDTPEQTKQTQIEAIKRRLAYVNESLSGKKFLMGDQFTVADAYLFTVLNWHSRAHIDLASYPNIKAFFDRVRALPSVQRVLHDEGLLPAEIKTH